MMAAPNQHDHNLSTALPAARPEPEAYLYLEHNFGWMLVAAVAIGGAAILGTLGNILIILSICCVRALRTSGNIFILNLALADMVVTLLIDPFNVVGAVAAREVLLAHPDLCKWIAAFCAPACSSSMWNMAAISVNRYVFICHPHIYPRIFTYRNSVLCCIAIWIIAHLIHMPNHVGWGQSRFSFEYFLCTFDTISLSSIIYSYDVFYIGTSVVIPLCGVLFGYFGIFLKVRKVKHQIRVYKREAAIRHEAKLNPTPATGGFRPPLLPEENHGVTAEQSARATRIKVAGFTRDDVKLAKTLFAVFFVFLCSWFLLVLFNLSGNPHSIPGYMYVIAMILAHGNSAVNPILYGIANERFRDGYREVLHLKCGRAVRNHGEASKQSGKPPSSGSLIFPAPTNMSLVIPSHGMPQNESNCILTEMKEKAPTEEASNPGQAKDMTNGAESRTGN